MAREQFGGLGGIVQSVDISLLDGHPKLLWKELGMLITNDAVEGRALTNMTDAERLLANLTRSVQRLDEQFGISTAAPVAQKLDVPAEFRTQLAVIWAAYLQLGDSLASDDFKSAKQGIEQLAQALRNVDMKLLTENKAHMAWMQESRNLSTIGSLLFKADDIKAMREHFESLSGVMQVLAISFGFEPDQQVFLVHCPMAFNNRGAIWLQQDDQTRNPYFGATMLKCADRKELIAGVSRVKGGETRAGQPGKTE